MMRAAIAWLPDGAADFVEWVDYYGQTEGPIRLQVRLEKQGDRILLDFAGSAAGAGRSQQYPRHDLFGGFYYALLAALGKDIPANSGCYRPIEVVLPEGSVVDARFPAPVTGRMVVNHRIATAVFGALAQLVPRPHPGGLLRHLLAVHALATVEASGRRRVYFDIEVGGWGGHAGGTGRARSCGLHNNTNAPIEMVEAKYPVTFLRYGLVPDSGGPGRNRGGLGLVREFRLDAPVGSLFTNFERFKHPPYGIGGGRPGSLSRTTLTRADGSAGALALKVSGVLVGAGDVITIETSGRAGAGRSGREPPPHGSPPISPTAW